MARLPALVDALAAHDGHRDYTTIANIARAGRECGLLPETTPGRGATAMTVRNAADLLIAANLFMPRVDACEAVPQVRSLRPLPSSSRGEGEPFKSLSEAATFGAAVELLIANAPALSEAFTRWLEAGWPGFPEPERDRLFRPKLAVDITSALTARIAVHEFDLSFMLDVDRPPGFYTILRASDRLLTARIGLPTVLALHNAVFGL